MTDYQPGDLVVWTDDDVDPPVQRTGTIDMVLSSQLLVVCKDGTERFVTFRNKTLRRVEAQ